MNAHISERTLREIYLKGYEIAIRKARPQAIMTGHNLVNGVNAAESRDLLIAASREEWGFDGLVMTDWGTTTKAGQKTKYGPSDCDSCIRAGTDLIMPGSKEDLREIISAVQSGRLSRSSCAIFCAFLTVFTITPAQPPSASFRRSSAGSSGSVSVVSCTVLTAPFVHISSG